MSFSSLRWAQVTYWWKQQNKHMLKIASRTLEFIKKENTIPQWLANSQKSWNSVIWMQIAFVLYHISLSIKYICAQSTKWFEVEPLVWCDTQKNKKESGQSLWIELRRPLVSSLYGIIVRFPLFMHFHTKLGNDQTYVRI